MSRDRVVVTGMGVVSPIGIGLAEFAAALRRGQSGVHTVAELAAAQVPVHFAAQVPDPAFRAAVADHVGPPPADAPRAVVMNLLAGVMAIDDAGGADAINREAAVGIYAASTFPQCRPPRKLAAAYAAERAGGGARDPRSTVLDLHAALGRNALIADAQYGYAEAAGLAERYGLRQCRYRSLQGACATSAQLIGEATRDIRDGRVAVAIVLAADSRVNAETLVRYHRLGALSTRNDHPESASRPFDAGRDGFVLGEGAGALVLEAETHAQARGAARVHAAIEGYGAANDATHVTREEPSGRGAVAAMRAALADAGVPPGDIDVVNAHGTSTPTNDRIETRAVRTVFGAAAEGTPVTGTKSMTGHLLIAAGIVEAIICAVGMTEGFVPPTINYRRPDPECDLRLVANTAEAATIRHSLSNAFGFGGQNACLVIGGLDT